MQPSIIHMVMQNPEEHVAIVHFGPILLHRNTGDALMRHTLLNAQCRASRAVEYILVVVNMRVGTVFAVGRAHGFGKSSRVTAMAYVSSAEGGFRVLDCRTGMG
jgi:hypothetical protein